VFTRGVLISYGEFSRFCAVKGAPAVFLTPCIAMLAYGYTFNGCHELLFVGGAGLLGW